MSVNCAMGCHTFKPQLGVRPNFVAWTRSVTLHLERLEVTLSLWRAPKDIKLLRTLHNIYNNHEYRNIYECSLNRNANFLNFQYSLQILNFIDDSCVCFIYSVYAEM